MKVYRAFIHFPNHNGRVPNIEMTILDSNQAEVGSTVRQILEDDGYDAAEAMMTVHEVKGPFEAGYILARYGG